MHEDLVSGEKLPFDQSEVAKVHKLPEDDADLELLRRQVIALGKRMGEVEALAQRAEAAAVRAETAHSRLQEETNRARLDADEARAVAEQAWAKTKLVEKRLIELANELREEG